MNAGNKDVETGNYYSLIARLLNGTAIMQISMHVSPKLEIKLPHMTQLLGIYLKGSTDIIGISAYLCTLVTK